MRKEIDRLDDQMRALGPGLRFANPTYLVEELRALSSESQELDLELAKWSQHAKSTEALKARLLSYRNKQLNQRS